MPEASTATEPWTVLRTMLWSADYLKGKGVESPRLDAEHILAHVLGLGRLEMYLQHERPLTAGELEAFRPLLKRRAKREPLQYVLGRQAFRTLELQVGPGVLIPRPETECLVDEVLDWARQRTGSPETGLLGLDVGTGSGAIALALLTEGPFAGFVGVDVSADALEIARRNADAHGLTGRFEARQGSTFAALGGGERFDVVVSNPPYVAESQRMELAPEIVDWEPDVALFGGADGLEVIREIVLGASPRLRPGGLLALEVGLGQAADVAALTASQGLADVRIRKDLAGRARMVLAHAPADNEDISQREG
ncbi:MAG: peptide chain release factor N(5)-glutamine methyltransferase [Gemmatimonadales bacterium]